MTNEAAAHVLYAFYGVAVRLGNLLQTPHGFEPEAITKALLIGARSIWAFENCANCNVSGVTLVTADRMFPEIPSPFHESGCQCKDCQMP